MPKNEYKKVYHTKGFLEVVIPYEDGVIHGKLKSYYENGSLESIEEYIYGKRISITVFNRDGNIIYSDKYPICEIVEDEFSKHI